MLNIIIEEKGLVIPGIDNGMSLGCRGYGVDSSQRGVLDSFTRWIAKSGGFGATALLDIQPGLQW